jgi:hypothetical protein
MDCLMSHSATVRLPVSQQLLLRSLLRRIGTTKAPTALGASRGSLERAAGGLPIRFGTALVIQAALERLPAGERRP